MTALQSYIGPPSLSMAPRSEKTRRADSKRNAQKIQIATLLIEAGANVNANDQVGMTPLHLAAVARSDENAMLKVTRELLRRGAVVDALTAERTTPLRLAVWQKRFRIARMLVEAGAHLDAADAGGKTAAGLLLEQGRKDVLDDLRNATPHK
jgi:ankyrin repeat protein